MVRLASLCSFQARELKFCVKIPLISVKIAMKGIFEILSEGLIDIGFFLG